MYLMALDVFGERMKTEAVGALATSPDLKTGLEHFYDAALDIYLGPNDNMARGCLLFTTAATEVAVNLASGTLLNLATRARAGTPPAALTQIAASTANTVATLAAQRPK